MKKNESLAPAETAAAASTDAAQAAAAAAAAAEAQAKEDAKLKADADKAAAKAKKVADAIAKAGVHYTTATGILERFNSNLILANEHAAKGDLEGLSSVEKVLKDDEKLIKEEDKQIRALSRANKTSEELSTAVDAIGKLVDGVKTNMEIVKGLKNTAKQAKKDLAKEAKEAEAKANAMPEQNGVRRPKPDTLCGRAWALFDKASQLLQQPVPVNFAITIAEKFGLNEGNVKTEYARWKKFNGVEGRIDIPLPEVLRDMKLEPVEVSVAPATSAADQA